MTLQSLDRSRPIPRAVDVLMLWPPSEAGPTKANARLPAFQYAINVSNATPDEWLDTSRVHSRRNRNSGCGRWMSQFRNSASSANSHLAGRDELQRPEGDLEIGSVGLEVVESTSNAGLQLRGVLAGRAVRRDLVELRGGHFGGCRR